MMQCLGKFIPIPGYGTMNSEGESVDLLVSDTPCLLTQVPAISTLTVWSSFSQAAQKAGKNRIQRSSFGEQVNMQTGTRALGLS